MRHDCALQYDTGSQGVVALAGPLARGVLLMGCTDGSFALVDPRAGYRQDQSVQVSDEGLAGPGSRPHVAGGGPRVGACAVVQPGLRAA